MCDRPSLRDEYQMLVGEIRLNRNIQLQAFSTTPIWLSVFFGLLSSKAGMLTVDPIIVLVPLPLIFMNLLLIVDRRRSSDVILAYFRTAFDLELTEKPGFNRRLPGYRRELEITLTSYKSTSSIPQRFDFNVIVWLSFLVLSLICCFFYSSQSPQSTLFLGTIIVLVVVGYAWILRRLYRQSDRKPAMIEAWKRILSRETAGGIHGIGSPQGIRRHHAVGSHRHRAQPHSTASSRQSNPKPPRQVRA